MFNLFKKKQLTLKLEEVINYINEKFSDEIERNNNKIENLKSEIKHNISSLETLLDKLKDKESDERFATSVRDKFYERIKQQIYLLNDDNFMNKVEEIINNCQINQKEFIHLRAFKDEMKAIAVLIELIEKKYKNLKKTYDSSIVKKIDNLEKNIIEFKAKSGKINGFDEEIERNKKILFSLRKSNDEKGNELKKITESREFLSINEIKEGLEELEYDQMLIKQKLNTEFGSIEKIMVKYEYITKNKNEKVILKELIESSASAFLELNVEDIKKVLESIKTTIENRKMDADVKKYGKIVEMIQDFGLLYSFKKQYEKNSEMIENNRKKLSELEPLFEEKKRIEKEIDDIEREIKKIEKQNERILSDKKEFENSISSYKSSLEKEVSDILNAVVSLS